MANTKSLDLESGSSQYASLSSSASLRQKDDFTLECWIKLESLPSAGSRFWLIDKKSESGEDYSIYALFLDNTGGTYKFYLRTTNGSSSSNIDTGATAFTPTTGVWYHIAVTRTSSGGAIAFYVNGVANGTGTGYNGTLHDNSDLGFYIGRYKGADGRYYDGLINEVRVWSSVRTQSQITANANKQLTGSESGLQGYWKFNNDYTDSTSNGNTLTSSGSPVFSTDVPFYNDYGNTNSLDLERDSTQYAYVTNDLGITGGNITMEAWIKLESAPGTNVIYGIADQGDAGSFVSYWIDYSDTAGVKKLRASRERSFVSSDKAEYTVTLSNSTWYHVALTYDGTNVKLWLDGVNVASVASSGNGTTSNSDHFAIGIEDRGQNSSFTPGSTIAFDGLIDDVRVWNVARTQAEITDNMFKQLAGNESNLVGYWKLNNAYTDSTSNGYNLTSSGSPVFSTDVPFPHNSANNSYSLDLESGSSQYASASDSASLSLTGNCTFEFWVKPESFSGTQYLLDKYGAAGNRTYQVYFATAGTVIGLEVSSNGTATAGAQKSYTFTTGVWTHIAISWTASTSTAEFYINGVSIGTATTGALTSIYDGTAALYVGSQNGGGAYYDGLIEDVRVWSEVRTQNQIFRNMATELSGSETNLQGYWKLNNAYTDTTSNANTLTSSGSPVFSTTIPFAGTAAAVAATVYMSTNTKWF